MQSSKLFIITGNNLDLTNRILVPTYKVSRQPKYESWEDSNWVDRRDIVRRVAKGTFTLKFDTISEYENFVDAVEQNTKNDGSVNVKLYLNKTHEMVTTDVYIDFEPVNDLPFYGVRDHDGIEVTIQER